MLTFKQSIFGFVCFLFSGTTLAATTINTPTVNGTWTLANSPYYIHNNISVPLNESLTIQPGVEVVFMGNYAMEIFGTIHAVGTPEQKIVFKAHDTTNWNDFTTPNGGWKGLNTYVSHFNTNVPMPAFEYCVIRDVKSLQGSAFIANYLNVSINHCEFFNNYTQGGTVMANYFGNNSKSKFKFTNNVLYNNQGGVIMSTLFTDSSVVSNNKFYNNNSIHSIFNKYSLEDTNTNVFIFDDNEMYNNQVSENATILNCHAGGIAFIRNNKFHHNNMTLQGAVSVRSKTALIEGNLIANNIRTQKSGFFCGINDGGAGLHLLGGTVIADQAGMNIYTVRNNIIANNHSDIDGAGIWANHCKVNIVNNTIINNTSESQGAAIHGWGQYCKINVQNNIISGNKVTTAGYDTSYYNFNFSPVMQHVNISHNLVDYPYVYAPNNILGLSQNNYEHALLLANPSTGAGISFDATLADFSPIATSSNVINKGNNSAPDYGTIDYLGNSRIVGNSIDMGAIEFKGGGNNTSINDAHLGHLISLYPIPAKNTLQLSNASSSKIQQIQIFSIDGKQINASYKGSETILQVDISSIGSGNYIMKVLFANGKTTTKPFTVL